MENKKKTVVKSIEVKKPYKVKEEPPKPKLNYTVSNGLVTVKNGKNSFFSTQISVDSSQISCGVGQMYNVLSLIDLIRRARIEKIFLTSEDRNKFFTNLFKDIVSDAKYWGGARDDEDNDDDDIYSFLVASNTANSDYGKDLTYLNSVLSSIAANTSEIRRNPNSGNNIVVWIF